MRAVYRCQEPQHIARAIGNSLCMKRQDKETAARIGKNLSFLIERTGIKVMEVAERSRVGLRTVTYMKNGEGNPTVSNVEKVARVFGLTSWHMLSKTLEQDYDTQEWLDRIHTAFSMASSDGQDVIRKATEIAEKLPAPPRPLEAPRLAAIPPQEVLVRPSGYDTKKLPRRGVVKGAPVRRAYKRKPT